MRRVSRACRDVRHGTQTTVQCPLPSPAKAWQLSQRTKNNDARPSIFLALVQSHDAYTGGCNPIYIGGHRPHPFMQPECTDTHTPIRCGTFLAWSNRPLSAVAPTEAPALSHSPQMTTTTLDNYRRDLYPPSLSLCPLPIISALLARPASTQQKVVALEIH